jgi:RND family efflux transporter MFP subunit
VLQDEVSAQKAERDLARGRDLLSAGVIPVQQVEDFEWEVKSTHAKLAKSKADLDAARVNLTYSRIFAPISGTIASIATQQGETVASSFTTPTFVTIIQDNAQELVAMVDETDIADVKIADPVTFNVEAYPTKDLSGIVQRINPTATIVSGVVNYEVVISIEKDVAFLKPDMTANISIHTAKRLALMIPTSAVHDDGKEQYVYVESGGHTIKRAVTIGPRDGTLIEIKKGLSQQDRVINSKSSDESKNEATS